MFTCPNCDVSLDRLRGATGLFWLCPACGGRAATVALLRKSVPREIVNHLWQRAKSGEYPRRRRCPGCERTMVEVPAGDDGTQFSLDVCTACQTVWFDPREYESLPEKLRETSFEECLPQEARERFAELRVKEISEDYRGREWDEGTPDVWWKWIPALFGLPVERESGFVYVIPLATWLIALLIIIASAAGMWDLSTAVKNYALIPAAYDRDFGLTFLTSFFIHGGFFHLITNLYFLMVFGDNVEEWLGRKRFVLLLLLATVAGGALHTLLNPQSTVPCIGASGGISGVITFYALQFPRKRLAFLFWIFFRPYWIKVPAYCLFFLWLFIQFFGMKHPQGGFSNVAYAAHLGGVLAGVAFWARGRMPESLSIFKGPVDFTKEVDYDRLNKGEG